MDSDSYQILCREASILLELPDVDRLGREGTLEHAGIQLALFFDEETIADRLFLYVDAGPVKEAEKVHILERLLMLNLLSGSKTSGIYALDPGSGNIIFCVHIMPLDHLDASLLASMLRAYLERTLMLQQMLKQDSGDLDFMDAMKRAFESDDITSLEELA